MRVDAVIGEGSSDPNRSLALKVRIRTVRGLESSDTTARDNAKFGSELSGPRKVRIRTSRAHWKFGSEVAFGSVFNGRSSRCGLPPSLRKEVRIRTSRWP